MCVCVSFCMCMPKHGGVFRCLHTHDPVLSACVCVWFWLSVLFVSWGLSRTSRSMLALFPLQLPPLKFAPYSFSSPSDAFYLPPARLMQCFSICHKTATSPRSLKPPLCYIWIWVESRCNMVILCGSGFFHVQCKNIPEFERKLHNGSWWHKSGIFTTIFSKKKLSQHVLYKGLWQSWVLN